MPAPAVPPTESAAVGGIRIPARWKRQGSPGPPAAVVAPGPPEPAAHDNDLRLSVMLSPSVTARLAITPRECRDPQGCNVGSPPAKRAPGTGEGVTGARRADLAAFENPIRFPMMGSMAGGGSFSLPSARNAPTTGAAPCRIEPSLVSILARTHETGSRLRGRSRPRGPGLGGRRTLTSASPETRDSFGFRMWPTCSAGNLSTHSPHCPRQTSHFAGGLV